MVVGFCCSNGVVKLLAPHVIVVPPLVLVEAIEVIVLLEVMDLRRLKLAVVTVVAMEDIRKVCSLKVEKSRVKIRIWNTECIYCISRLGSKKEGKSNCIFVSSRIGVWRCPVCSRSECQIEFARILFSGANTGV